MNTVRYSTRVLEDAKSIVTECMGMEDPFCKARCPMSTDVKTYVHQIAEKDFTGAIQTIRKNLFLPGTLGRICAHPCERECRRAREFEQPMSIAGLKRFAADKADNEGLWDLSVKEETGKKIAIIGSGPSGAQAAIDLRKEGHQVTVYEKNKERGGMLHYGIPKFRLPRNIVEKEYSYLDLLGIEFQMETEIGKEISFAELLKQYDAVILAQGAQLGTRIPLKGAESNGVFVATEFLKEVAEQDVFTKSGKNILVIGGGDVAMDCCRSAIRLGVDQVYQCSLESEDILPANLEEKNLTIEEGVQCNFGWGPEEILEENGNVVGIILKQVTSVFDENGKFSPSYGTERRELKVDTIIMATGQRVEDLTDGMIEQKAGGRYKVDPDTLSTNLDKVFVTGDAAGGKIAVEAMALGRKAAISVNRFLTGADLGENRDFEKEWSYETKLDVPLPEYVKDEKRIPKNMRSIEDRIHDFESEDLGYTMEQAIEEAGRCLQCSCQLCLEECVMMNENGSCPKELMTGIESGKQLDANLVYSCNDCDSCKIVCPKQLPVREVFMQVRNDMVKANYGQPPVEHRAVEAQQALGFYSMFTTKVMGGETDGTR